MAETKPGIPAQRTNKVRFVPSFTVVSTRTLDRIPASEPGTFTEVPGGPAFYIPQALDLLPCTYTIITGELAQVEVITASDGEHYVIPPLRTICMPPRLPGNAVILSPIMREIDPMSVPDSEGILVMDLQGFVREPHKPTGSETSTVDISALLRRITIVKASESELSHLNDRSREALEECILLLTYGERGSVIRNRGKEYRVSARPVQTTNTIGAGDTFLSAFVYRFLHGDALQQAGEQAARFTEAFLSKRSSLKDMM